MLTGMGDLLDSDDSEGCEEASKQQQEQRDLELGAVPASAPDVAAAADNGKEESKKGSK
jgi:hypothetical protein